MRAFDRNLRAANRVQQTTMARLERALRDNDLLSYAWYDALWELERAGDAGLRPFELEQRLPIAQSNISRLIDRMCARQVVGRRGCPGDGRGVVIHITEDGLALRRRMWPHYAECIGALLDAFLTPAELSRLTVLLRRANSPAD